MTQPNIINFVMNLSNKTANNQLNWQQVLFLEPSLINYLIHLILFNLLSAILTLVTYTLLMGN